MSRLRSPAQRAPQTTEQATVLLARYAEASAQAAAIAARRLKAIARIEAATDTRLAEAVGSVERGNGRAGGVKRLWGCVDTIMRTGATPAGCASAK